ncbi:hypothetical protein [uncultured Amnibacterium sp.]|uniref:hypothetical protein n=1 Tax=uncultured Amnibacterium sp. TaxID=1631851 RepID=UPI0035CAA2A6
MRDAELTTASLPTAALALIRRAADAQRSGATGVVVVRLTEEDRLGRTTGLLRFAHALGLRTILEVQGAAIERLVARRPELVAATVRATDAVVVESSRSAALVRDLSDGRLRVEIAAPSAPSAVRRLQRTLTTAA